MWVSVRQDKCNYVPSSYSYSYLSFHPLHIQADAWMDWHFYIAYQGMFHEECDPESFVFFTVTVDDFSFFGSSLDAYIPQPTLKDQAKAHIQRTNTIHVTKSENTASMVHTKFPISWEPYGYISQVPIPT